MKLRFLLVLILFLVFIHSDSKSLLIKSKAFYPKIGLDLGYSHFFFNSNILAVNEINSSASELGINSSSVNAGVYLVTSFKDDDMSKDLFKLATGFKYVYYSESKSFSTALDKSIFDVSYDISSSNYLFYFDTGYQRLITSNLDLLFNLELSQSLSQNEHHSITANKLEQKYEFQKTIDQNSVFNGLTMNASIGIQYSYIRIPLSYKSSFLISPSLSFGRAYNFSSKTNFYNIKFNISTFYHNSKRHTGI